MWSCFDRSSVVRRRLPSGGGLGGKLCSQKQQAGPPRQHLPHHPVGGIHCTRTEQLHSDAAERGRDICNQGLGTVWVRAMVWGLRVCKSMVSGLWVWSLGVWSGD